MRPRKPKTTIMRIRKSDYKKMKKMAEEVSKQLPDFQNQILKFYKKKK